MRRFVLLALVFVALAGCNEYQRRAFLEGMAQGLGTAPPPQPAPTYIIVPQPTPVYVRPAYTPPIRCISNRVGNSVFTNCY